MLISSVPARCAADGAGEGIRTPDLLITNQLLYQPELRQPDQNGNYSTSRARCATTTRHAHIRQLRQLALLWRVTALPDGLKQHDAGGDRHVHALDMPPHRDRHQPVAAVPHHT